MGKLLHYDTHTGVLMLIKLLPFLAAVCSGCDCAQGVPQAGTAVALQ